MIDLSHHQGQPIDFAKVKAAGIVAVMHKATEGNYMRDAFYQVRRDAGERRRVLWGAYHFGAEGVSGKDQARYILEFVGDLDGDFVCLDFESYSKRDDPRKYCMTLNDGRDFIAGGVR
jgi:lysozyme